MGVKRPNRRDFLKRGAALAGGVTLGAAEPVISKATASAQSIEEQSQEVPSQDWSSDELVAYGERSLHVKSVREPVNSRPSPDEFGLVFHTWLNRSDHRSREASPHDPRLGGP